MIGRMLSHYRVEEQLGAGGMGVVYRAYDERLNRAVALKILPEPVLDDAGARRQLRNEAAALLRLSHPRIGTIFDFDTAEGVDFIVMEFVPGETLERKLEHGPLPLGEAVRTAIQIAEALEEAHDRGVVHRDLKPGNCIVSARGQVKVVDFGLAKLLDRAARTSSFGAQPRTVTEVDTIKGTPSYMAPEQLLSGTVDARTDLFALGIVMYEMLTGDRPFKGETTLSLANTILNAVPRTLRQVDRHIPVAAERVVMRCLEKDPARRYPNAAALLGDLRGLAVASERSSVSTGWSRIGSWGTGAAVVLALAGLVLGFDLGGIRTRLLGMPARHDIRSIAVLPLENLSEDPQQGYFAEGMTDALITDLAQLSALRVISRTSVMGYKNRRVPLRQIARELDVDAIVTGVVIRSGNQVRISAELIKTSTDEHLWARSYDRTVGDVLGLQSELASAIAEEIRVKLEPQERAGLTRGTSRSGTRRTPHPVDAAAQDAYLKGRYFASKASEGMLRVSLKYFQDAIGRDPQYAEAYAGLANTYVLLASSGSLPPGEGYTKAKEAARKALELDGGLAEAHTSLGLALFYHDWDWVHAESEFKQAIALNPGSAYAYNWYGVLLSAMGRHPEAISAAGKAAALDPLSLPIQLNVGVRLYYARQYERAAAQFRRLRELEPDYASTHYWLGLTLQQTNQTDAAIAELRQVEGPSAIGPLGYAYAVSGKKTEASQMLTELSPLALANSAYVSAYDLATICAGLGRKDEAFEWLNRALQEHASYLTTVKVDPIMDALRSDPRFAGLVKRLGVPA